MKRFNKDRSRTAAKRYRTDITAIIYNGLTHDVPKRKVYQQIKREIAYFASENPGIQVVEKAYLWNTSLKMYTLSAKQAHFGLKQAKSGKTYEEVLKKRSIASFDVIKRNLIGSSELSKVENDIINRIESRWKMSELEEIGKDSIFFLCDAHEPCADDHKLYQGRLYIRENWENYVDDPEVAEKINAYLHNHPYMKKQTLEWVLGYKSENKEPSPYLIRRPNCKHRLEPVSIEEVLGASTRTLLMRKKMIHKHEKDQSAADRSYRAYSERLETLHALYRVMPSEKLGQEIKETSSLAKKWSRMR